MTKKKLWIIGAIVLVIIGALVIGLVAGRNSESDEASVSWQEQYDLGVRYLSEGNYEEAIIAFTAAIEIDPKKPDTYEKLADVYIALGDIDKAKKFLEQGVEATESDRLRDKLENLVYEGPTTEHIELANGKWQVNEYNEKGSLFKYTRYNSDGTIDWWSTVEYDEEGKRLKETKFNPDGTVFETSDYGNNNSVKQTYYNSDGTINWWAIQEYETTWSNLIKETNYNIDGIINWCVWEYDETGNLEKETIFNPDGTISGIIEYADMDIIKKETMFNPDGTISCIVDFDEDGNEVSRTYYNPDGSVEWIEETNEND